MLGNIPEGIMPVELLSPATDAAGRTSAVYPSLKNVNMAWIVCFITQGNAATIALAPKQATTVNDTLSDTKVLANVVPIWANEDAAAGSGLTKQTSAVNFTTSAAVKHKIVVFQIDPEQLDLANNFDCIGLTIGASNAANLTSALLFCDMKFKQASPPDVMAN